MPFLGQQPVEGYKTTAKQTITGDGSTSYTLDNAVTSGTDLEVFINNVRQEPGTDYSASGNTITFTTAVESSDSCWLVYQGRASTTTSIESDNLADGSVTAAKLDTTYASTASPEFSGQITLSNNASYDHTIETAGSSNQDLVVQAGSDTLLVHSDNVLFRNSAGSAESVRINTSGISFDAGSNALDDYEEGTWTPTIYDASSVNHTSQDGAYIKIGKLVYITCRLAWNSLSGTANEVSGLPYTALSQPKEAMSSNVYVNGGFTMASGKTWINFYTMANQTRLYFTQQPNTQDINFGASGNIYFQTVYITS